MILYEQQDESSGLFSYILYDYLIHRVIKRFDNQGKFYSLDDDNYMNCASFSPKAQFLTMAFNDGTGKVINLSDFTERSFNCRNENCRHYSNWLVYGRNDELLHSSMFEGFIKIYDGKSLELIDSINNNQTYSSFETIDMSSDGSMCITEDYSNHYIYYKAKEERKEVSYKGLVDFERVYEDDTIIGGRYKIELTTYGVKFSDMKNEVRNWELSDPKITYEIIGYIHNNKYILLSKRGFRGEFEGIDIVDLLSGKIVDQTLSISRDPQTGYIVISKMNNQADDINEEYEEFIPFEELTTLCKKATAGMKLSKAARRKFFLN